MKALALLLLAAGVSHAAPDAFFDGSRSQGGAASAVQGHYRADLSRKTAPTPKSERPAPPPLGDDKEKEGKKKSDYEWSQDAKAGLAGGVIGMVLASTLVPWGAPIIGAALLGFAIGALIAGGISRFQQYLAVKKKKEG